MKERGGELSVWNSERFCGFIGSPKTRSLRNLSKIFVLLYRGFFFHFFLSITVTVYQMQPDFRFSAAFCQCSKITVIVILLGICWVKLSFVFSASKFLLVYFLLLFESFKFLKFFDGIVSVRKKCKKEKIEFFFFWLIIDVTEAEKNLFLQLLFPQLSYLFLTLLLLFLKAFLLLL